jgi:hypothetical protein
LLQHKKLPNTQLVLTHTSAQTSHSVTTPPSTTKHLPTTGTNHKPTKPNLNGTNGNNLPQLPHNGTNGNNLPHNNGTLQLQLHTTQLQHQQVATNTQPEFHPTHAPTIHTVMSTLDHLTVLSALPHSQDTLNVSTQLASQQLNAQTTQNAKSLEKLSINVKHCQLNCQLL